MFNLNVCCCMLGWEDIEKWKGYQAGTSGSEFNLPDFSARLTCAANMDMDGEVMGAKGGPPPELEPKKAQNTLGRVLSAVVFSSDTEYWTRPCEHVCNAQ